MAEAPQQQMDTGSNTDQGMIDPARDTRQNLTVTENSLIQEGKERGKSRRHRDNEGTKTAETGSPATDSQGSSATSDLQAATDKRSCSEKWGTQVPPNTFAKIVRALN